MVTVTIQNIVPATVPYGGWKVMYREKGSSYSLVEAVGSPFMSQPFSFDVDVPAGTLLEGTITAICQYNTGLTYNWVDTCGCPSGWNPSADEQCVKTESTPPTTTITGCLSNIQHNQYSTEGTRIYQPKWWGATPQNRADALFLPEHGVDLEDYVRGYLDYADSGCSHAEAAAGTCKNYYVQWRNTGGSGDLFGPMNRSAIWVDSDCDGDIDTSAGAKATASLTVDNSAGPARFVYLGMGGDNQFLLKLNGTKILDTNDYTGTTAGNIGKFPFRYWHIVPMFIIKGINVFNMEVTNDGDIAGLAMVVYDNVYNEDINLNNTYRDLLNSCGDDTIGYNNSTTAASGELTILADTADLITTTPTTVITCPPGYSVVSVHGTVTCSRAVYSICNGATSDYYIYENCAYDRVLTHQGGEAYTYPTILFRLDEGTSSAAVHWEVYSRPNRITVKKDGIVVGVSGGVVGVTSGWMGDVSYGGPWGATGLHTAVIGEIPIPSPISSDDIYEIVVETPYGGGVHMDDTCTVKIVCIKT